MSRKEDIYLRSPRWAQHIAGLVYGLAWKRRRFGSGFEEEVVRIRARDRWGEDQFHGYVGAQLHSLFSAARNSPHYFPLIPDDWSSRDPKETLRRLPILTKAEIRQRGRSLLTTTQARGVKILRSSGTTGTPLEIFYSRAFHQLVQAYFEVRVRNIAGVTFKDTRAMFGSRKVCAFDQSKPPFWRRVPAENLAYCSIYHLSPSNLPHYVDFLKRFAPAVIMGYPNSLAEVARFALATGDALPPARAVLTTSETVTDELRTSLESAWGCRVTDSYGLVEGCALVTQCRKGRYHVSSDFGVLEILDDNDEPCPAGVSGRVVATGLHNHLQPLIRYEVGDVAAWSVEQSCSCGLALPIIERIEGRYEDMCYTPDGRAILRFDTVFKGVTGVQQGQIVQVALDRFEVRVVVDGSFGDEGEQHLSKNMRAHVGSSRVDVVLVNEIPRTAAGKFRPVVSMVGKPGAPNATG